uniref:EB domain-containing protein n=1 Tax=Angiostrongylus cantonensis TaxID=6313 RepID=A0A0K0D3Q5_ANGCA
MKTKYTVMREAQPIPKHAVIDQAALRCEFDYQCRMGESCSGVIALVDRNITVCQYDVTKVDRLCIFHADCLQGQQCRRSPSGVFVCTPSIEAELGTVSCVYDYECSGGEKCLNIAGPKKAKIFRCRQSQANDPRHDQLCKSNAECPYQQVSKLLIVIDPSKVYSFSLSI